ncbi:MAG: hypothetical protein A2Y66_08420 [Nitrospirae bacterium RBG_13_41_22]|jgi:glycosyltransferase involved in cell wall biosynthesis|nr:MAG: hypothetical protein A2Y66_08420 [Nitrospirae bacterium RBG_13_41_22]
MQIGINAQLLSKADAGVANYAKNLIKGLINIDGQNNYSIFGNPVYLDWVVAPNAVIVTTNTLIHGSPRRILWEQFILPFKVGNRHLDIMHYPDHTAPLFCKVCPITITVHDLAFLSFPKTFGRVRRIYKSLSIFRSAAMADRVIVVSEATKKECLRFLNIPEERISVIYNGVHREFGPIEDEERLEDVKTIYGLSDKVILYVGTLEPRKNILNLVNAFYNLKKKERISHQLVLAGGKGWLYKEVFEMVEQLGMADDVKFTEYVPKDVLSILYNIAEIFVYPSIYEGFGLPPLEAMACGCPVVVSNVASLPEVCGDAAYYVDPYSVESIAEGIYKVLTDEGLRQGLIQKGLERANLFSWEKSAKEHIKVFEEVLNS